MPLYLRCREMPEESSEYFRRKFQRAHQSKTVLIREGSRRLEQEMPVESSQTMPKMFPSQDVPITEKFLRQMEAAEELLPSMPEI